MNRRPVRGRALRTLGLVGLTLAAAVARPVEAGVAAAWAVNDGEKIARDATASPWKARNSAWDGSTVTLFAARNEIVAFQVVVEADASGIAALSLALPELRNGASRIAYGPPASDPSLSAGRPIQVFSVHYLNVTAESKADWAWKPGSPAAPRDPLGWKPVVLVPENAKAGKGGLPLRVAPSQGQALWVEIYTGRDRPAGIYRGTIAVTADGARRELPIELELLDFALPDANSMDAMVYYEPSEVELYHGRSLDAAYHRFAHRYRIELVHAYDEAAVRAAAGRLDRKSTRLNSSH